MKKVIAIVGPTAVGKTKISIELAKHFNMDIISADSVAVYKDLNIGSAKPTVAEMDGVKHYLIDDLDAGEQYNVEMFQEKARKIIEKNNPIIIAGGTGLYVQSVLFNYEFKAVNRTDDFEKKFENYTNQELYDYLYEKDNSIKDRIHPNNRKRVLRALEILDSTNESITKFNKKNEPFYDSYIVYLNTDRTTLYERINKRVDIMIDSGLLDEVKSLYDKGITPSAIGYKEFIPYFKKEISLESAIEEIKKNSRRFAKRQITWFKNQMDTHFYDVDFDNVNNTISEIICDVEKFLGDKL